MVEATQQEDVVGPWITFNAPGIDPAWAFKQAMDKYTAPPASERLEKRKNRYRSFMESFIGQYKDKGAKKVGFDGTATWPEVLEEATLAFDDYTKRGRSWRHPFRSTQRLFGSVACRIEFLIVLLPDGDFTGALCGGLTLVYNATRRKRDIQELIIRTLDSLSEHIEGTKAFLKMYAWDEDVRQKTEDLYIAVLEAIEALTEWLQRSSLGESLKAFFEQSDYGKKLEEKLSSNLQEKASSFGDCVSRCLHKMVQAVHHNVLTVGKKVEDTDEHVLTIGKKVEDVDEHVLALKAEALRSLEDYFLGLSRDLDWQFNRFEERQRNFYLQNMQANPQNMNFLNLTAISMPTMAAAPQPLLTVPALLGLLGFSANSSAATATDMATTALDLLRADQAYTLFFGRTLPPQTQSALRFATQSHHFQAWFRSLASRVLTVHGMDPATAQTPATVSATSYLCALLSQSVARMADGAAAAGAAGGGAGVVYPVSFYCRLHGDAYAADRVGDDGGDGGGGAGGKFHGPVGMMRFLVAQMALLLVTRKGEGAVDLSRVGVAEAEGLRGGDLNTLCSVFDDLVKQVGVGVVVCMVDWVSWFEREPAFLEGLHMVMLYLNSLVQAVEQSQTGLVFKLLVTSPMTSQFAKDWFPRQDELYLPGGSLMGAQGFGEGDLNVFM